MGSRDTIGEGIQKVICLLFWVLQEFAWIVGGRRDCDGHGVSALGLITASLFWVSSGRRSSLGVICFSLSMLPRRSPTIIARRQLSSFLFWSCQSGCHWMDIPSVFVFFFPFSTHLPPTRGAEQVVNHRSERAILYFARFLVNNSSASTHHSCNCFGCMM